MAGLEWRTGLLKERTNTVVRKLPAWTIYIVSLGYAGWLLWLGISNQLGPDPVNALEHLLGEAGLYLMIAGLTVTPIRRFAGVNLIKFRRAIGLATFFFLTLHLMTWAILDVQQLSAIWADIVKRPYITVGMAGFLLMVPLAFTSNNLSMRKLGPLLWRKVHLLVYPASILGAVHYVMLVKGWQIKPLVFLAIVIALLAIRVKIKKQRANEA